VEHWPPLESRIRFLASWMVLKVLNMDPGTTSMNRAQFMVVCSSLSACVLCSLEQIPRPLSPLFFGGYVTTMSVSRLCCVAQGALSWLKEFIFLVNQNRTNSPIQICDIKSAL
jgi:hypothetical protein